MTVLTIRSHRSYAVRQPVNLRKPGGRAATGLMIELSSEGCRISNLARGQFAVGEQFHDPPSDRIPEDVERVHHSIVHQ